MRAAAVRALALALLILQQAGRPPTSDPVLELARARKQWNAAHAVEGAARELALERALETYLSVVRSFPQDVVARAEAHFRRGEILRAAGRADEALGAFDAVVACGARTPFHARATLEIGHLHRRAGRLDRALDAYVAVYTDTRAPTRYRDSAALWAGSAWVEQGRIEDARRTWNLLAQRAERPGTRIDAYDRLALLHCEAGNPGEARALVARCAADLDGFARELTELGKSVRSALQRMRVRSCLAELEEGNAKDPTRSNR